jgi:hypothetical protein
VCQQRFVWNWAPAWYVLGIKMHLGPLDFRTTKTKGSQTTVVKPSLWTLLSASTEICLEWSTGLQKSFISTVNWVDQLLPTPRTKVLTQNLPPWHQTLMNIKLKVSEVSQMYLRSHYWDRVFGYCNQIRKRSPIQGWTKVEWGEIWFLYLCVWNRLGTVNIRFRDIPILGVIRGQSVRRIHWTGGVRGDHPKDGNRHQNKCKCVPR